MVYVEYSKKENMWSVSVNSAKSHKIVYHEYTSDLSHTLKKLRSKYTVINEVSL